LCIFNNHNNSYNSASAWKLALGAEAFLSYGKAVEPEFKEGDKVEAFVLDFNEEAKSINLSQLDKDQKKAKEAKKKIEAADVETGAPTLGEMSGLAALKDKMEAEEKEAAAKKSTSKSSKKDTDEDSAE